MCVPFTGSEAWTRSVGYKIVDEWRPWTSKGQIAGYFFCFPFIKPCETVCNELHNKTIEKNLYSFVVETHFSCDTWY